MADRLVQASGLGHAFLAVVLDLKRPEAQELIHQIIPQFDVFVINSRAGVSKRLRLDYER